MRSWTHSAHWRFRRLGAVVGSVGLVDAAAAGSLLVAAGPGGARPPPAFPTSRSSPRSSTGRDRRRLRSRSASRSWCPRARPAATRSRARPLRVCRSPAARRARPPAWAAPSSSAALAATGVYSCTVTATNSLGTSLPSAPFFAFLGGQGRARRFRPRRSGCRRRRAMPRRPSAGRPPPVPCIAGYVVTPYLAGVAQTSTIIPGQGTTTVVKNLLNGVIYTFTVAAENGITVGPASDPTAPITVGSVVRGRRPPGHKGRQGFAQDRVQCTGQQWRAHHELLGPVHVEQTRRDRSEVRQHRSAYCQQTDSRKDLHMHSHGDQQPRARARVAQIGCGDCMRRWVLASLRAPHDGTCVHLSHGLACRRARMQ